MAGANDELGNATDSTVMSQVLFLKRANLRENAMIRAKVTDLSYTLDRIGPDQQGTTSSYILSIATILYLL